MKISVIVPTLNEAEWLGETLTVIEQQEPHEIIVVDGGSSDGTVELASRKAHVIHGDRGRSKQFNAGAAASEGDVLLFVHADSHLPPTGLSDIRTSLTAGADAGAFRLRFDRQHPVLKFSALCTRLPINSFCFGDRGLFVRRSLFDSVGGYPDQPVFEDIEMVNVLAAAGQFRFLKSHSTTSARRYLASGVLKQQWTNTRLWLRYNFGEPPERLSSEYTYSVAGEDQ